MIQYVRLKWLIAILVLALPATAQAAITIDTVAVGNTGNTADSTSYGAVGYNYNIGTYEVTAGQYTEFLNAVAVTDTYGLYNASMNSDPMGCQITQIGGSGSYTYNFSGRPSGTAANWADRPVNYVSFWDAARFANWLHNGQPTGAQGAGTTESGAYLNIDNQAAFVRQAGALFFIPTEDEWYKAAYHKNDGDTGNYYDYPTMSDVSNPPSNDLDQGGNNATFYDSGYTIGSPYYRTEVGAHKNSESPYRTFDQSGNVGEWNETAIGSSRGLRGGSFQDDDSSLQASARYDRYPADEYYYVGFRVASSAAIPEPGSVLVWAGLGIIGLIWWRRRR